jgi:hypothetical protein
LLSVEYPAPIIPPSITPYQFPSIQDIFDSVATVTNISPPQIELAIICTGVELDLIVGSLNRPTSSHSLTSSTFGESYTTVRTIWFKILQNLRAAMGKESHILIHEVVLPDVNAHWHAAMQDISMAILFGGKERSKLNGRNWLDRQG